MTGLSIDEPLITRIANLLKTAGVPPESESTTHSFAWKGSLKELANSYLAIVAICHQTTPLGERALIGTINGSNKMGWDYLKERFLIEALLDAKWAKPGFWSIITPTTLSALYRDSRDGLTLNRISERCWLLNNLGDKLRQSHCDWIEDCFNDTGNRLEGTDGFFAFLGKFEAYSDPVRKKSSFFVSVVSQECHWRIQDPESLLSPVDYHELRGHLRLGTVYPSNTTTEKKIHLGLTLTPGEDVHLRTAVQKANLLISQSTGLSSSAIHYLFWNVFRNCCPRDPRKTHCAACPKPCTLPVHYRGMPSYTGRCLFATVCKAAGQDDKLIDPPYAGHYY